MKRKAEAACVDEEEDPKTGEVCLKAGERTSITSSSDKFERRRRWRKSDLDFQSGLASSSLGSMLDVFDQVKKGGEILNILAGKYGKNTRNPGENIESFTLRVINGEPRTYIDREIPVSKEYDLHCEHPEITIAQRTYSSRGEIELKAHRLCFKGCLDLDRPYIFPGLGDEIPGVGYPDLHCTFRGIRDWDTVAKAARFESFDRNLKFEISARDVQSNKKILFDTEGTNSWTRTSSRPPEFRFLARIFNLCTKAS